MANPTRYIADVSGLVPWVADDIVGSLPRAVPESSMEAMMAARRLVNRAPLSEMSLQDPGYAGGEMRTRMAPHEWDASEAERFGDGWEYARRIGPRGRRYASRVPSQPMRPYPFDQAETRATQRRLTAEAILDKGRQNPDILQSLPTVFRLPVSDDLIVRLASESPQVVLRKALQDNPEIFGGLMGAGSVLGGGIAYGLLGGEEPVRAGE